MEGVRTSMDSKASCSGRSKSLRHRCFCDQEGHLEVIMSGNTAI